MTIWNPRIKAIESKREKTENDASSATVICRHLRLSFRMIFADEISTSRKRMVLTSGMGSHWRYELKMEELTKDKKATPSS